ncbi:poly(A)-specific ribonuclease [Vanrija albida]|uniref:PAN2-PAN3 deadenylation complex catalytic subunit PAN2 n=1 Tax=Vanrija albida TaxID=181172 RepID=A0ABR3Q1B1_9TREE
MTTYNPLSLFPLPPQASDPKPVPAVLAVDSFSDMLWVGSSNGLVSAFASPLTLTRNVQFPATGGGGSRDFLPNLHSVRKIRVSDREVWSLTDGGMSGRRRGGAPRWSVTDPNRTLRAMTPSPTNSHEVLAGGTGQMMLVNNSRGEIVRRFDGPGTVMHLGTTGRTVVCASGGGQVSILDPRTGFRQASNIAPVQAHTGGISGADAQGNVIATWGWTHMQGHPIPDSMVRLYDTRTLRPLPPISFSSGAAFVLLNPTDPSKLVIAGQQGMIQISDMSTGTNEFQQLDVGSFITSMALSPRGDYLAFGDADGQLHLWTTHATGEGAQVDDNGNLVLPPFNGYDGVKPEWPDPVDPPPPVQWEPNTPLNIIGMPFYEDPLLSNFSPVDYATVYSPFFNPPEQIPASVLASLNYQDFVGYGQLPKELKGKRNVATARAGAGKLALGRGAIGSRRESEPRFRSDKDRKSHPPPDIEEETPVGSIPKYYRKVEIKYSRFGVEDFDFGYYNRTCYSGLETDIINSYTNALLQALHYTYPLRAVAKAHICVDCQKEHCLLCEAGFLFRMLEDAKGTNCQASNFSRAFSATPQASALGLMHDSDKATAQSTLIQNFNRWLMSTFTTESVVDGQTFNLRPSSIENMSLSGPLSAINQVLGIAVKTTNTCLSCHHVSVRESTLQTVDLAYTRRGETQPRPFHDVLRSAIIRSSSTKATCSNCKLFAPLDSKRDLAGQPGTSLPPLLSVNTMANTPEQVEVWKDRTEGGKPKHYLSRRVAFRKGPKGDIVTDDGTQEGGIVYEVKSVVVQVQTAPDNPAHLLSFVKMPAEEDEEEPKWIMFNDFLVRPVKEEEVFSFPDTWKVPAIIILERVDADKMLDYGKLPKELDVNVLFKDHSMAWNRRAAQIRHQVLSPEELPKPGTLISIDAEFVLLQQEELEFRSDGTKKILRPSHMSLARVSVLRGPGSLEGVPFIDDYIRTTETVVDYLTEFSGIKAGDLDPNNSPHTLVPLKVAYKKLRLLVDLGCIFIGHGLSKDFRTINIFVPPEQVQDTVNIYTIPGRSRKLSLRFLTWFLLKRDIQTKEHDSIEDARHAYLLYMKYLDFEADGRFEDVMEDIFAEGHKTGFKPKAEADRPPTPSAFPPLAAASTSPPPVHAASGAPTLSPPQTQARARGKPLVPAAGQPWSSIPPAFVPGQPRWR